MTMVLRRMEITVTVHGFRSTFLDWTGDATNFPRNIAEAALAHAIGNEVDAAYRRSDALAKRRTGFAVEQGRRKPVHASKLSHCKAFCACVLLSSTGDAALPPADPPLGKASANVG